MKPLKTNGLMHNPTEWRSVQIKGFILYTET